MFAKKNTQKLKMLLKDALKIDQKIEECEHKSCMICDSMKCKGYIKCVHI